MQMKDPLVFLHSRFLSQLWVLLVHSSISEKREKHKLRFFSLLSFSFHSTLQRKAMTDTNNAVF